MNLFKVVFTNETEIFVAAMRLENVVAYLEKYNWMSDEPQGKRRAIHSITWQSWVEIDRSGLERSSNA